MYKSYELKPVSGQKSFWGKAFVKVDSRGNETLFSYGTKILKKRANGDLIRFWGGWSATTQKHINAFCGLNKAGFLALPVKH